MPIISQNQPLNAKITMSCGTIDVDFGSEASFALGEIVTISLPRCSMGLIYSGTHYDIAAELPDEAHDADWSAMTVATLHGIGAGGNEIRLSAPIMITSEG